MNLVICLLVLIIAIVKIAENHPTHITDRSSRTLNAKVMEHVFMVNNFKCRDPQPRLIPVEELFNVRPLNFYTPRATVLHRCGEDTGCCTVPGEKCVAEEEEFIELVFSVYDTEHKEKFYDTQIVSNHTLCKCQSNESE